MFVGQGSAPPSLWRTPTAVLQEFDYVFSENGLVAYKRGELLAVQAGAGCGRRAECSRRVPASKLSANV